MSLKGEPLVSRRVFLPNDASVLGDRLTRHVMERIPVEIWHEILLISIAFPLLLDHNEDRNLGVPRVAEIKCDLVEQYRQSETVRMHLRLVCQSWNQFLDGHSDRLVQLTPRVPSGYWPPVKRWDRVVRIDGPQYICCFCDEICWPPALHGDDWVSNIDSPSHLSPTQRHMIEGHLNSLSERCMAISWPGFWRDELVKLPALRSVTILKEDFHRLPDVGIRMSVLSGTYQKLTHLEIVIPTLNDPSVNIQLPLLTTLWLTVRGRPGPYSVTVDSAANSVIGPWKLPNIRFIQIDGIYASEKEINSFNLFIRRIGRTVSTLILRNSGRGFPASYPVFSAGIWSSLPALTRLGVTPTDLLHTPGPPENLGGAFIDLLLLDTDELLSKSGLGEDLAKAFPTEWPASILGNVVLDILWEQFQYRAARVKHAEVEDNLGLFAVLHRTGKGLTDSAGVPFDSNI